MIVIVSNGIIWYEMRISEDRVLEEFFSEGESVGLGVE